MKSRFILIIGKTSNAHIEAIKSCLMGNYVSGFKILDYNDPDKRYFSLKEEINTIEKNNQVPIIMKGYGIHTEEYIRPIIRFLKDENPKENFFLTHFAMFKRNDVSYSKISRGSVYLTDAALMTNYSLENVSKAINNAVNYYLKHLRYLSPDTHSVKVALLNAGGSTNKNTMSKEWSDITSSLPTFLKLMGNNNIEISVDQLDSALCSDIRNTKVGHKDPLPDIVVPSSINEGNSIWKCLTLNNFSVCGLVLGSRLRIGLNSRTDSVDSITLTLNQLIKQKGDNEND